MDCETCSDLLLDLHYDELDDARAGEVRAHLADCDECRAASERLGRTRILAARLALPDAPPSSAAVMAALSATVAVPAAVSGRVSAVIPIERAREARAAGWLQRVGELAMRRQVAMAAVFMLMVGLGLRYMPLRSPTQSITTEMTQPEVVPATELRPTPSAPAPTVVAQATTPTMRARAPVARATATPGPAAPFEGRVASRSSGLDLAANARGGLAGSGARSARDEGVFADRGTATGDTRQQQQRMNVATAEAEVPVAAAAAPPEAPVAPGSASSYGRAPIPMDEERQLQQAGPPPPAPAPTTWTAARSGADSAAARGDLNATIAGYRQALRLNPPPSEQQAIARDLVNALNRAGNPEEATRVRAQYLTPAADPTSLAGQVSPSVPRTATSAATAQPSAPRPTSARPARRSNSNANVEFNQSAY